MAERIISVSQLNEYVGGLLSFDPMLKRIAVRGEISGLKRYSSGHIYFSLKDEAALVRCVCFKQQAQELSFAPADGMSVVAGGSVALYVRDGAYQMYVKTLRREGVGDLHAQFEILKARLLEEGLFDEARKRALPFLPRCIGVVTSGEGAVIRDIERVSQRRFPGIRILLSPARVQGEGAAEDIARALGRLAASGEADVIIVGRGGGSFEDLNAFNGEAVARAIYECPVPVISAVGHETDYTIADFVADVRAPTPSAAAELATPEKGELRSFLADRSRRLDALIAGIVAARRRELAGVASSHAMRGVKARINEARIRLDHLGERALQGERALLEQRRSEFTRFVLALNELSPLAVLKRGYAIARLNGVLLKSASQADPGDAISVTLGDGTVEANVIRTILGESI